MATNTYVSLRIPEAADLADLSGIRSDLEGARDWAQMLGEIYRAEKPNWLLAEPLSVAILVKYSRSFITGVRKWLDEDAITAALTDDQRAKHRYLRNYRDKHIAHSVNAFEENVPVGRYWLERVREEGITSVECNQNNVVGLGVADLDAVSELCSAMIRHVDGLLATEKSRVLAIVRAMPLDDVLINEMELPKAIDHAQIGKARRR